VALRENSLATALNGRPFLISATNLSARFFTFSSSAGFSIGINISDKLSSPKPDEEDICSIFSSISLSVTVT
jgi:hypothetical protein